MFFLFSNMIFTLLLAYNRFVQMIFQKYADEIFSKKKTTVITTFLLLNRNTSFLQIFIVLSWLLSAPYALCFATPIITFEFAPFIGFWWRNGKYDTNTFLRQFGQFFQYLPLYVPPVTLGVYSIIVAYLMYQVTHDDSSCK